MSSTAWAAPQIAMRVAVPVRLLLSLLSPPMLRAVLGLWPAPLLALVVVPAVPAIATPAAASRGSRQRSLVYPLTGILEVATPAGVWLVPPHRAAWIPAAVPHAHRAHGPTEMRTLVFPAATNPLNLDHPTVLAVDPLLREVITALTSEEHTPRRRRNHENVALDRLRTVGELPLCLSWPRDDRLAAVARTLADNPADDRTLAALGRDAGAAERTLSRLFRAETGMTFPQWRLQLRLQHAVALLAGGEAVTAVAGACGFATPSAFVEAFRKALGVTPGRYRQPPTQPTESTPQPDPQWKAAKHAALHTAP